MKKWADLKTQVQRHVDRGLVLGDVSDREFKLFLYSSNYYRVSGYGRCFYEPGEERYKPGTVAKQLMDIHELDRRVRNMVLDGISVVEPTLRGRVAYHVSESLDGGDGYLQEAFYLPSSPEPNIPGPARRRWVAEVKTRDRVLDSFEDLRRRDEIFIQHHINKDDPVPFWAIVEVASMGTFSKFLKALRDKAPLVPVTRSLGLEDESKFLQAVHNLTFLRNIAAHHGRLWNRRLSGHATLPSIALAVKRDYVHPKTPAALLTLLAGLVDRIEDSDNYSTNLLGLVHSSEEYSQGCYRPIL